jgi:hypothetical protein
MDLEQVIEHVSKTDAFPSRWADFGNLKVVPKEPIESEVTPIGASISHQKNGTSLWESPASQQFNGTRRSVEQIRCLTEHTNEHFPERHRLTFPE